MNAQLLKAVGSWVVFVAGLALTSVVVEQSAKEISSRFDEYREKSRRRRAQADYLEENDVDEEIGELVRRVRKGSVKRTSVKRPVKVEAEAEIAE